MASHVTIFYPDSSFDLQLRDAIKTAERAPQMAKIIIENALKYDVEEMYPKKQLACDLCNIYKNASEPYVGNKIERDIMENHYGFSLRNMYCMFVSTIAEYDRYMETKRKIEKKRKDSKSWRKIQRFLRGDGDVMSEERVAEIHREEDKRQENSFRTKIMSMGRMDEAGYQEFLQKESEREIARRAIRDRINEERAKVMPEARAAFGEFAKGVNLNSLEGRKDYIIRCCDWVENKEKQLFELVHQDQNKAKPQSGSA